MSRFVPSLMLIMFCMLLLGTGSTLAQAPEADRFEENDSLAEATFIAADSEVGNLTMVPAADPDWFRVLLAADADYRIEVLATPGLDLTLTVYDDSAAPVAVVNAADGPNASVELAVEREAYYALEVVNTTDGEGFYVLRVLDETPQPTPTSVPTEDDDDDEQDETPTPTPQPTPTLVTSPTPVPGDFAEPNFNIGTAYRIVPGDVLEGLTFEPSAPGTVDNDYFALGVRAGITYTCQTENLGPGIDTNLIISDNLGGLIGGSDDIDTQAGEINSRLTFTATYEGDVYLLLGTKSTGRSPGDAPYSLSCMAGEPVVEVADTSMGAGVPMPVKTTVTVRRLDEPVTPTPVPTQPQTVDLLVAYDLNDNGAVEPNEGIDGLSVRVVDVTSNRQLAHGFTDETGTLRFTLTTTNSFRVVIPFLGAAETFRPGSPVTWTLLIPAGSVPGLLP